LAAERLFTVCRRWKRALFSSLTQVATCGRLLESTEILHSIFTKAWSLSTTRLALKMTLSIYLTPVECVRPIAIPDSNIHTTRDDKPIEFVVVCLLVCLVIGWLAMDLWLLAMVLERAGAWVDDSQLPVL
jgi:hypothetical protein